MAVIDARAIATRTLAAAALAAILNAGLVAVGGALQVAPGFEHLVYARVVVFTVVGVLGAGVVFAGITRIRSEPRRPPHWAWPCFC